MDSDKLNLKNIKQLLIDSINEYYNIFKLKKNKNNEIVYLNNIISLFENEKYNTLYYNFENYEDFLKKIEIKINQTELNNIYFYISAIVNNYNFKNSKNKYEFAISNINNFKKKLIKILEEKQKEYETINTDITYQEVSDYQIILTNMKTNNTINHYAYDTIRKLLTKKGYLEEEIIILLERIRIYNSRIKLSEKGIKYNPIEGYKLLNILDFGFEKITIDENIKSINCDNIVNSVKILLKHASFTNLNEILPSCNEEGVFTYGFTIEEFKYIINSLLVYYQSEMYKNQNDLKKIVYYDDKEYRKVLIDSYNECLTNYLTVRNYYDSEIEKYNRFINLKKEENIDDKNEEDKNELDIYYLLKNNDKTTYFEDDLKSISYDVYDSIKDLLIKFRKNKLGANEIKSLNEVFKGLRELRNDQVRILFRHIEGNKYIIVGVFIKQADNDRNEYRKMFYRPSKPIINYKECEEIIFNEMDKKRRDGGRKK